MLALTVHTSQDDRRGVIHLVLLYVLDILTSPRSRATALVVIGPTQPNFGSLFSSWCFTQGVLVVSRYAVGASISICRPTTSDATYEGIACCRCLPCLLIKWWLMVFRPQFYLALLCTGIAQGREHVRVNCFVRSKNVFACFSFISHYIVYFFLLNISIGRCVMFHFYAPKNDLHPVLSM